MHLSFTVTESAGPAPGPGPAAAAAPAGTLHIGPYPVWPPVVLAPMAGITNASFRSLCREFGAGLYVCEMITTRALVAGDPKTREMIRFGADEHPRSVQLYGVDPVVVGQAVRIVVEEDLADHIDLNFGCPVPKVTRKGGGSALPYKRELFESIVRAAVDSATDQPPTAASRSRSRCASASTPSTSPT